MGLFCKNSGLVVNLSTCFSIFIQTDDNVNAKLNRKLLKVSCALPRGSYSSLFTFKSMMNMST